MRELNCGNFGLVIAYLLPGFVTLVGVSFFSEPVRMWLSVSPASAPTVGGFLYVTLASLAAGVIVSTIRWASVDTIHRWTGVRRPDWNYAVLHQKVAAYEFLVSNLYRYYQFYGLWRALHKPYYADVEIMRSWVARLIESWSIFGVCQVRGSA